MTSFDLDLSKYDLGWSDEVEYAFTPEKGLNAGVVDQISWWKGEPRWMTEKRLRAYKLFERKPMAEWFAVNMPDLDFQDIYYYLRPKGEQVSEWDQLPEEMMRTYEKLGIPEAERQYLAGVTTQYESEVVYHKNRVELEEQGILFCDMDTALREYPHLVKEYFGTIIPPGDNKLAALNSAVWSGGSFIYVPPGVNCEMPLQAYFRINAENAGQFERTLIIADEGSQVHYIEGCSAPVYSSDSLHSAVVEIVVKPHARVTYTTIQNWSPNVYNLVTKRARVEHHGHMEWIDGNIGCLAEGSTVTTPSGVKPIELLVPGEQVLSFDHATGELVFREVTAKRFSGVQPVRDVSVGARSLRVTDNHPFLAPEDSGLAYVRADCLRHAMIPTDEALACVGRPRGGVALAAIEAVDVTVSEHVGEVRTWDIEVAGTGNFVSQGFIVHNSKLTMKYPSVYLVGEYATGEVLSVAYAGAGQHQDAGAKMIHAAPNTSSKIVSKSISKDGGITTYRGLVRVDEGAHGCKSHVQCDALILDEDSTSKTLPYMEVGERDAQIGHEATVSKIADEQIFYLQSRGLSEEQAIGMVVNGFIEPITRTLPMEYAVEWSRLIELQMEGSVG
jgi:Fe-S cluster assembly scaffold protein SufB